MDKNQPESNFNSNTSKAEISSEAKGLLNKITDYLKELFDYRDDTDQDATLREIKEGIPFKGATAWILIFAVFVASIGLNANSTAVVIGAMLISPLMGPILGLGMSFAINDIDTFKMSLRHLVIMIGLSLFASFMFFYLFPLSEDTSELLGRVKPDIRDVLIAFFGGLALMVAKTKKGTIASVIFGVAIATALMPPLCTAGYGLAKGNFVYFGGAMYLFIINTIFIALAGFLVLKLLAFPMHKYANAKKRKRYATIATITGIAVMIPAIFTFIKVFEESQIEIQFNNFIENEIKALNRNNSLKAMQIIGDPELDFEEKEIRISFFNEVTDGELNILKNQLNDAEYNRLKEFNLLIKGSDTKSFELITNAYQDKRQEVEEGKRIIQGLQDKIDDLEQTIVGLNNRIEQDAINRNEKVVAFSRIAKESKIRYLELEEISFANVLSSKDFINIDTMPMITIKWSKSLNESEVTFKEAELRKWLQTELSLDTLYLKRDK